MLACDLVVAADHATFGIPEVQRGLAAGAGGLVRLPKRVGLAVALEMAMTGDPVDAATAQQLGLVNRVVPGAHVLDAAVALASSGEPRAWKECLRKCRSRGAPAT